MSALSEAWENEDWATAERLLEDEIAAHNDVRARSGALYNLACARARAGDRDGAFSALAEAITYGEAASGHARADPDLASLTSDPRWDVLLGRMERGRQLLDGPQFSDEYRETLSAEERAAGLALVWSTVRTSFVGFDRIPDLDWDSEYMRALTEVLGEPSTERYYLTLKALVAKLRDGHSEVWFPHELRERMWSTPPVQTSADGDGVVITRVTEPHVAVRVGDELLRVDGLSLDEHVASRVAPYVSASTQQDFDARLHGPRGLLLAGTPGPVALTLERKGNELEVVLDRAPRDTGAHREAVRWEVRKGVGILTIDSFETSAVVEQVDALWPSLVVRDRLVIDLRNNGGGDGGIGFEILTWLADSDLETGCSRTRVTYGTDLPWGRGMAMTAPACSTWPDDGQRAYDGRVALVVGPRTYSAAEDFVVAFRALERGPVVGAPTGGSTGQPVSHSLPGGGGFRVCAKRDTFSDSTEFVGVGIQPDIAVAAQPVRNGKDAALAAAIEALSTH